MSAINYSKWDALELSDDSDIEVHPNVDKRSFIRAKQNQIHQQRVQRRHEIETLKYERIINDGLLKRIDALLSALNRHKDETGRQPDEIVFQALIESAGDPSEDTPPTPPEGIYTHEKEQPKYSKMMGTLIDQVKEEVDKGGESDRLAAYIKGVGGHHAKVLDLQQQLLKKLAELEKEEKSKITSESIHTGFDSSHVAKSKPEVSKPKQETTVEVLNPGALQAKALSSPEIGETSGSEADIEDGMGDDESGYKLTKLSREFTKFKLDQLLESCLYVADHPKIATEEESDALLVEAFNAESAGKEEYARRCTHQSLLIQYCQKIGWRQFTDSIRKQRAAGKLHDVTTMLTKESGETYANIKKRAAALKEQEAANPSGEQEIIQLHATEPGSEITINIPAPITEASTEEEKASRQVFESFPPGLRRALESGKLDQVNEVLGKMSLDEAEEVVEKLGDGNMLSMVQGVVDGTTEEGKEFVEKLEKGQATFPDMIEEEEEVGEPGGEEVVAVDEKK